MSNKEARCRDITQAAPYPMAAMAAGILLIFMGGLLLLCLAAHMFAYVLQASVRGASTISDLLTDELGGMMVSLIIVVDVMVRGVQTVRGRVKESCGNGIWSLFIAVLCFSGGGALVIRMLNGHLLGVVEGISGVMLAAVFGPGFLAAAVLAIKANRPYLAWRQWQRQSSNR